MPSATFTTSGTWAVPANADPAAIQVWAWAEGGNSGSSLAGAHSAGGGGSGAIAGETALGGLTPGVSSLSFTIGTGGTGTDTSVTGGSVAVTAHHGNNASGSTAGTAGAAGSNTVARAGSAGGSGIAGSAKAGGSGAGSPGSTGSGGAGGTGPSAGGAAGTGAAGPPSLAGAQGGTGGAASGAGTDGSAPGAGAGGPGNSSSRVANQGAPGQVIIIWATISGISLTPAQVSIQAFAPSPGGNSLTVTAAGAGAITAGILLRVRVLDNAALPSTPNTATATAQTVSITPDATGSLVYSALTAQGGLAPTGSAGNTVIDGTLDGSGVDHGTFVSASRTAGVAFTAGGSVSGATVNSFSVAAVEVQPYGGTITTNASSPAVATGSTTATTAGFSPPTGAKLLVALVSSGATTAGVPGMTVTDSYGLTWTQAVMANANGQSFAGIWYAYTPASMALTRATPGNGTVGTFYSYAFAAKGGYGAYSWSVASGSLPAGLSLSNGGILSGTPTTAAVSTFTVAAVDAFGNSVTSSSLSVVINKSTTPGGVVRATWTGAAPAYSYGTLQIPVSTTDHDWVFVSVSWVDGEDPGIAYCADDVQNTYQPVSFANGIVNNQVFCVPNAAAASTVYVSTSAYVRWLTACVLDVTGLQPGLTVDAVQVYSGSSTTFTETLSTTQPDFVLAAGAFRGVPATITQAGSGATWTALTWAGINGSSADGLAQSAAWAEPGGAATPVMQFTAASGSYAGSIVAVSSSAGLPVNDNPAWPVIKCQAAFGYTPQEPTVTPSWTDITGRFNGIRGRRGRSFELDEVRAADMTLHLDNFDGALSPGGSFGADLITPVQVIATWQGRTYTLFRGMMTSLPQTYDFQRGQIQVTCTDDFSKLTQTYLATCMTQEMLYDKPVSLWPLNEQKGALAAGNWSSRSVSTLTPVAAKSGGGQVPSSVQTIKLFGVTLYVKDGSFSGTPPALPAPAQASASNLPNTGFSNQNTGTYPAGLMGTQDSVWGNTTAQAVVGTTTSYQGTALVDANDSTLPLTSTGATYAVWTQMFFTPSNPVTGATIFTLTDAAGPAGGKNYLTLYYNGTTLSVSQTAGSHSMSPSSFLFDSGWHLWAATITTGGTVTVYLDGAVLGTFSGSFPAGTPTMIQWGGDTTATTAAGAGIFTGCMALAGAYDRVVDPERIATWYQSGATGFQDELAGQRIQRILAWAHWSGPQAIDPGLSLQQEFNYLTGGYGNNGLTGAIGQFNTAGGAAGVSSGSQADATMQDIANTDNGFLFLRAEGTAGFTEKDRIANFPVGLAMGDMDYALNAWQTFGSSLGPWTSTVSCTVAQDSGWSYANQSAALVTVTGTPVTAYAWGDSGSVAAGGTAGFSCWVMSPQGCTVRPDIDWYNASNVFISTSSGGSVNCPPMTPVFLSLAGAMAPAGTARAFPHPTLVSSPATGTQLYFDRPRLSPAGFQVPYGDDVEITEDVQFLFNDIAITRNVDQATYRARDSVSRGKYYPRVYTRTIYSSVNDLTAVQNCATFLVTNFAFPANRVSRVVVDAAENPEAWAFVLSADIGDNVSFARSPVGVTPVTGSFTILSVEPEITPDKAQFTYVLAPAGVF